MAFRTDEQPPLSTITNANQIVVVHNGKVEEIGTHEGLLAKNGRYANMWSKQIRAEEKMKKLGIPEGTATEFSSGYNTPRTPADPESSSKPIITMAGAPYTGQGGNEE